MQGHGSHTHIMRDCPNKLAYIATDDGGYVSASDEEDEYVFAANHDACNETEDITEEAIDTAARSATYQSIIV